MQNKLSHTICSPNRAPQMHPFALQYLLNTCSPCGRAITIVPSLSDMLCVVKGKAKSTPARTEKPSLPHHHLHLPSVLNTPLFNALFENKRVRRANMYNNVVVRVRFVRECLSPVRSHCWSAFGPKLILCHTGHKVFGEKYEIFAAVLCCASRCGGMRSVRTLHATQILAQKTCAYFCRHTHKHTHTLLAGTDTHISVFFSGAPSSVTHKRHSLDRLYPAQLGTQPPSRKVWRLKHKLRYSTRETRSYNLHFFICKPRVQLLPAPPLCCAPLAPSA